jgi:Fanconi anemia group M protein
METQTSQDAKPQDNEKKDPKAGPQNNSIAKNTASSLEDIEIIVDDRELKSPAARHLFLMGVKIKTQRLNLGDFVVSEKTILERKTMQDFEASIIDGRLFQQVVSLKNSFYNPIIAVIGKEKPTRLHEGSFWGAIFSLSLDFKVPVIFFETEEELAKAIVILAKRENREKKLAPIQFQKPKDMTSSERQLFVTEALPNIGPNLARSLLKEMKTLKKIFNASEDELKKVEGIGEEKAKRIVELAEKEFDEK